MSLAPGGLEVIDEATTRRVVAHRTAIAAVIAGFVDLDGRRLADIAPPRLQIPAFGDAPARSLKAQLAPIPLSDRTVLAAHLYYAGSPRGTDPRKLLVLADEATGSFVAAVESEYLSTVSTAALTIAGMHAAGVDAATRVAIVGTGKQARMHARAVEEWYRPECITLVTRNPASARERVADLGDLATDVQLRRVDDAALEQHEVFITATRSATPVLDGARVPPTATVCAIGAHAVGASELDEALLRRAERVIVDHAEQAEATYEEVISYRRLAQQDGRVPDVREISEVQAGAGSGGSGITIIKTGGTAFETAVLGWACVNEVANA